MKTSAPRGTRARGADQEIPDTFPALLSCSSHQPPPAAGLHGEHRKDPDQVPGYEAGEGAVSRHRTLVHSTSCQLFTAHPCTRPKRRAAGQSASGPPARVEDKSEKVSEDWDEGQNRQWRWGKKKWLSRLQSQGCWGSWRETRPHPGVRHSEGISKGSGLLEGEAKDGPQQGTVCPYPGCRAPLVVYWCGGGGSAKIGLKSHSEKQIKRPIVQGLV